MGNTINVQGSYIDIHDNETVNLSVSGAEVNVDRAVVPAGKEASEGKSEEEIARGIEALMPLFTVKSQWVAIYRVLVDFYGWPGELTAFCQRVEQLPVSHALDYRCDYQAVQKAKNGILAKHYKHWESFSLTDKVNTCFSRQKLIAVRLLTFLRSNFPFYFVFYAVFPFDSQRFFLPYLCLWIPRHGVGRLLFLCPG